MGGGKMNQEKTAEPAPMEAPTKAFEAMQRNAFATAEAMDQLADALSEEQSFASLQHRLTKRAEELRANRFRILVVGEFKRGKSTVLNALLAARVLPQKLAPCTAILTLINYAESPCVEVHHIDDTVEKPLTPKEFQKKYELQVEDICSSSIGNEAEIEQRMQDRFGHIDHARVFFPAELCRNGVELVDSPGLEEHPARTKRVLEFLKSAHAIVMVLDAIQLLNDRELRFIHERLRPLDLHTRVFFLINRWNDLLRNAVDPHDEDEVRQLTSTQEQMIDIKVKPLCYHHGRDLSTQRIFRINALGALQARIAGKLSDDPDLLASQIPAFETALNEFLSRDRYQARQATDRALLTDIATEVKTSLQRRGEFAQQTVQELEATYQRIKPRLDEMRRMASHIAALLTTAEAKLSGRLCAVLTKYADDEIFSEQALQEFVQKMDLGRLGSFWVAFDKLGDIFRSKDNKLKVAAQRELEKQVSQYLTTKLAAWKDQIVPITKVAANELEIELKTEAKRYVKLTEEVGAETGSQFTITSPEQQLAAWTIGFKSDPTSNAAGKISFDVGMVVASIMADVALHASLHVLPVVGFVVSGIVMMIRSGRSREKLRAEIFSGLREARDKFLLQQEHQIRAELKKLIQEIEKPITSRINEETNLIDADLRDIIAAKEAEEFNVEQEVARLATYNAKIAAQVTAAQQLLVH
jgi:hypothetical protein